MDNRKLVLILGNDSAHREVFHSFGRCCDLWDFPKNTNPIETNPKIFAAVVFTGGTDINPIIYGEKPNKNTQFPDRQRDYNEMLIFNAALKNKIPMIGICRGAQFLCAKSGGRLIQHVTKHHGPHRVRTYDNRLVKVNSIHHQMCLPPKTAKILAWAEPALSEVYEGPPGVYYDIDIDFKVEADCVYYPETNSLGLQYHPEYLSPDTEGFKYAQDLIWEFLNKTLPFQNGINIHEYIAPTKEETKPFDNEQWKKEINELTKAVDQERDDVIKASLFKQWEELFEKWEIEVGSLRKQIRKEPDGPKKTDLENKLEALFDKT